jgi:DNA-binding phage protein
MDQRMRRERPGGERTTRRGNLKALKLAFKHRDRIEICEALLAEIRRQGIMRVAKLAHTTRGSLYASFGPDGNPTLERLLVLTSAIGVEIGPLETALRTRQAKDNSQ